MSTLTFGQRLLRRQPISEDKIIIVFEEREKSCDRNTLIEFLLEKRCISNKQRSGIQHWYTTSRLAGVRSVQYF